MNNLNNEASPPDVDYNALPVYYCASCLSLKIMRVPNMDDACYCEECGNTHVEETGIHQWEELYKGKYGFKFLENEFLNGREERET